MNLVELRQALEEYFNIQELTTLCFDMGIEIDKLPGEGRGDKARELVALCLRLNRIDELKALCQERRPHISWIQPSSIFEHEEQSPFKGLESYKVEDADLFFGRNALIAKLEKQLISPNETSNFLAIVGASGSGKSSLIRAGLVPRIQNTNYNWLVHIIRPTNLPLIQLANTLTDNKKNEVELMDMAKSMRERASWVLEYSHKYLQTSEHLLIIVDQFEELFTECKNESDSRTFVDNLLYPIVHGTDNFITVVIVLRADFYHRCAEYDTLRYVLTKRQEYLGAMESEDLRKVITEPAGLRGYKYENNLVDLILHDVGREPGNLPLLSHTLDETWKRRNKQLRLVTHAGYQAAGGVRGAIAKTADKLFSEDTRVGSSQTLRLKNPFQEKIARNIFLRLTELGEGTEGTRHRATIDELITSKEIADDVIEVIKILADARLITVDKKSVEIAHEALIREWPRLRGWLEENREILLVRRRLSTATQLWLDSNRDRSLLYRGTQLKAINLFADQHYSQLNIQEREFIKASQLEEASRLKIEKGAYANLKRYLMAQWLLASAIGGALGGVISRSLDWTVDWLVLGAIVGLMQWFILRGQVKGANWWMPISAIGFVVGFTIGEIRFVTMFLVGIIVGSMQWFILRRELKGAGWWILATAVGFAVGMAVMLVNAIIIVLQVGEDRPWTIVAAVLGAIVGSMQWFILRGQVKGANWWMPISAIGFAVGAAIGEAVNFALFTGSTNLLDLSLVFVVVGITISLMQSFAPRQKVVAAGWWIPATAISLAVVLAMDKHTFSENDWTVLGTFVGVIVGLITGPVLIRIASQEGPAILHEKA